MSELTIMTECYKLNYDKNYSIIYFKIINRQLKKS